MADDPTQALFALLQAVEAVSLPKGDDVVKAGTTTAKGGPGISVAPSMPQTPVNAGSGSGGVSGSASGVTSTSAGSTLKGSTVGTIGTPASKRTTSSPSLVNRPLNQIFRDVDSMTQEQRRMLLEQLAVNQQVQMAAAAAVAAGGSPSTLAGSQTSTSSTQPNAANLSSTVGANGTIPSSGLVAGYPTFANLPNLSGMGALSAAANMLSTTTTGNTQAWQALYPSAAGWPAAAGAGQSTPGTVGSQFPTVLPVVYQQFTPGGALPIMSQMQFQTFPGGSMSPMSKTNSPTPSTSRAPISTTTQQLRDSILAKSRVAGSATPQYAYQPGGTPIHLPVYTTPKRAAPASSLSASNANKRAKARPTSGTTPGMKVSNTGSPNSAVVVVDEPPPPTPIQAANQEEIKKRVYSALATDQRAVLAADISAFKSWDDMVERLLPYHLFQLPEPQLPPSLTELGLPGEKDIVERATAIVDQFNDWQIAEKRNSPQNLVRYAERLVFDDVALPVKNSKQVNAKR